MLHENPPNNRPGMESPAIGFVGEIPVRHEKPVRCLIAEIPHITSNVIKKFGGSQQYRSGNNEGTPVKDPQ